MSVSAKVRQDVLDRDAYTCVRCGTYVGPFGDFSIHHRRPRGMGGTNRPETNQPANLIVLCGTGTTGCHGYVESNRTEALAEGLLLSQTQVPHQVPVLTYRGLLLLDNEGNWKDAA